MVERRNSDFHDLSVRLTFQPAGNVGYGDSTFNVYQCDALFWMVGQHACILSLNSLR